MKKLFAILLVCLAALPASANLIRVIITVTNNPAISNKLVLNGSTRTWTNDVSASPSTLIATNNGIGPATTNLYIHLGTYPFSQGHNLTRSNNNVIAILGAQAEAMTATASGWGTVTYQTNITTNQLSGPLDLPIAKHAPTNRVTWANYLAEVFAYMTSSLQTGSVAMAKFADTSSAQGLSNKTFYSSTNISGYSSNTLSKRLRIPYSATETNGLAFENGGTIGSWLEPDAFGIPKLIQASDGGAAEPSDPAHLLTLKWGQAIFPGLFYANNWIGTNFFQLRSWFWKPVDTTNSYAIGNTNIGGQVTNANIASPIFTGTNAFNGMITLKALDLPSLSFPGPTHNVSAPTTPVYEISGASANFSIDGFALPSGSVNQAFWIINPSAFNMTLVHNAGDPAASNRMISLTGADQVTSGAGAALLWYSTTQNRWIILQFSP